MVSFKVKDCGNYVRVFDLIVECRRHYTGHYYYLLSGELYDSFPVTLDVGHFDTPDEAYEVVEYIEKNYPDLFEFGKNVDHIRDIDFYPEFSAEAVRERRC